MSNCWLNSYGKFGGAARRRFFAICEKLYGGVEINPPAGARVKTCIPLGHGIEYCQAHRNMQFLVNTAILLFCPMTKGLKMFILNIDLPT